MVKVYLNYVDGKWRRSKKNKTMPVVCPATGKTLAVVQESTERDVDDAVAAARYAFDSGVWSRKTPGERSNILLKFADLIEKNLERLSRLEALNQGKSLKMAHDSDIPFAVDNLRFFAGAARVMDGIASAEYIADGTSILRREPIGVVAAITPWNYPLMMAVWKAGPALAAGNTLVLKPASYTPLTTLELAPLAAQAGIPPGVLNIITGSGAVVGNALARHHDVNMISLTGSTETGKQIMRLAAENLKKVHLELGGKAPFIVFEDADLDAAAEGAVVAGVVNSGQDCTAAARLYVQKKVYKKFLEKIITIAKKVHLGDSLKKKTDIGPMVSQEQLNRVMQFVERGKKEGAKIAYLGKTPSDEQGYYMPVAVMTNIRQKSSLCQQEIFGPIMLIFPFKTLQEVIAKANDVKYGLASSVWTKDIQRAFSVASRLQFGEVWINDHLPLASEVPHGGVKQSGHGHDMSRYALEEYTTLKHIYVDMSGKKRKSWHYTVYGKP